MNNFRSVASIAFGRRCKSPVPQEVVDGVQKNSLCGSCATCCEFLLERFPATWNHAIEKELLNFKELEHAGTEKAGQLFRDPPVRPARKVDRNFDYNMLQLFRFELRPYRSHVPFERDAL